MSQLRNRLDALRAQTGIGGSESASPRPAPTGATLRERLERCAVARSKPARMSDSALAQALRGRRICDGLIVIDDCVALGVRHGRHVIANHVAEALNYFGHRVDGAVFMDTETTGLSGGTGTLVFLLGLARFEKDGLHVQQYFLTSFAGEAALLERSAEFLSGAQAFVTYNGKSFDHPLLSTRYRLARMADPFASLLHIDLLHPTRRAFALSWPDCRLQTAEQRLLGFIRRDDLPGAEAPTTWFDWIRRGDIRKLPAVIEHNHHDLVSLAALLPALLECHQQPEAAGADPLGIARHHLGLGDEQAAYRCLRTSYPRLSPPASMELARLARRRDEWDLALTIWQALADADQHGAWEQLAKYYEHRARDVDLALQYTRKLLAREPASGSHRHRHARLVSKANGRGLDPMSC